MQYHALALAVNGSDVDLIGLEGAPLPSAVTSNPRITVHTLPDRGFRSRLARGRLFYVGLSAVRAALQAVRLHWRLWRIERPDVILVQSPPAVPTLAIAWLVARARRARLVIDWHNLAHTLLAVRLGEGHRAVRALARSERRWGGRADGHLAVSQALAEWLHRHWRIRATVVYDRPTGRFAPPADDAAAALWQRLSNDLRLGASRIPLVVCPTSWTPDEDFDLLLEALERADRALAAEPQRAASSTPALAVLLTGRGELRAAFEQRLARRDLHHLAVRTVWLEPGDYPVLIGMADAGLCLHQSASGLDLPMKLADFRGAGVPVMVFDYGPVLSEVLTSAHEGALFHEPGQLAQWLVALARHSPEGALELTEARRWLTDHPPTRWEAEWMAALPQLRPRAAS